MIVKVHRRRPQLVARLAQQPRQHAHPVEQQPTVRGLKDVRLGHRGIDAHPIPRLDP